jgi:hypothetical protein
MILSFPDIEDKNMNFIRRHLISAIQHQYELNRQFASGGFIYLDNMVELPGGRKINRINGQYSYCHEEIVPMAWDSVPGKCLAKLKDEMKQSNFYSYKLIDGKSYKIRKKK